MLFWPENLHAASISFVFQRFDYINTKTTFCVHESKWSAASICACISAQDLCIPNKVNMWFPSFLIYLSTLLINL